MKELDFKTIGDKIKERRVSQFVTQEMVADELDVNPSHISNIECGRAHPSLTALVNIANTLECSVDYFIGGEYTYLLEKKIPNSLDNRILNKLKSCDAEKKKKILTIMDLL